MATSFASGLVELFRESTLQIFVTFVLEITSKTGVNVLDHEVRLTFVMSGNMLGYYALYGGISMKRKHLSYNIANM